MTSKVNIPGRDGVKPRLCFALPGINYAHVTSNVIPARRLAEALSAHFDITFVARSFVEEPPAQFKFKAVLEQPCFPDGLTGAARATFLGRSILEELAYLRSLEDFAQMHAKCFDIVIERQWRYAGVLTAAFKKQGVSAGFCTEGEIFLHNPPAWIAHPRRRAGHETLRLLAHHARKVGLKSADFVICETEQLARRMQIVHGRGIEKKLSVAPPGTDTQVFRPLDRTAARAALGLSPQTLMLVYLGALNGSIQCPGHVIEGLARSGRKDVMLHIIGTGDRAEERAREAKALGAPVVFHGYKPQAEAINYIAAADLCVAPYRRSFYPGGEFTSASCKVSEYLASGRPVLTIPCARMNFLTDDGRFGFLVENTSADFAAFFGNVTQGEILQKENALENARGSGELTRSERVCDWNVIASRYRDILNPFLNV